MPQRESPDAFPDFSLTSGGAFYRLMTWMRLVGPPMQYIKRRALIVTMVAWLPLLVLSIASGTAIGGVEVPFARDIATHVRLLVCLPLLLFAEVVVHHGIQPIVEQFLIREIVPKEAVPRFRELIVSTLRVRDSLLIEVVLFVITLVIGQFVSNRLGLHTSSWYSTQSDAGSSPTLAGRWYLWVSIPMFQFILLRWLFRWSLWVLFLFRVSRLPLHLVPTHPDGAAGLSFLSRAAVAFAPVLTALSGNIAGVLAGKILYENALLPAFLFELITTVLLLVVIALGPLFIFMPLLAQARRRGEFEYGALATHYVQAFDRKWNHPGAAEQDEFMGSADIQSLADLANSYGTVDRMRMVPFDRNALFLTAGCAILPLAPLVLFIIPIDQLVLKVLGLLF